MKQPKYDPRENIRLILEITGMSEAEYNETVFEAAYKYVRRVVQMNDSEERYLVSTPMFWSWWKRQWFIREEALIGQYFRASAEGHRINFLASWHHIHAPAQWLNIVPSRIVMASYIATKQQLCRDDKRRIKSTGAGTTAK